MADEKTTHPLFEEHDLMLPPRWSFNVQRERKPRAWIKSVFDSLVYILAIVGLVSSSAWMLHFGAVSFLQNKISQECSKAQVGAPYSPVQHLEAHDKKVSFDHGFDSEEITMYQGPPTPERDAAWQNLYNFGLLKIPRSAAAQLANKTVPIPGDTSNYAISLDVFHQLHCLNMVRKHMWSLELGTAEYRSKHEYLWHLKHVDHCIDELRQSLMCSADTAPVIWAWSEARARAHPLYPKEHMCRDYDGISDWAKKHRLQNFEADVLAVDEHADFKPARI